MEGSSPSIFFVFAVNMLLFFSKHEPVEADDDEVANNGQGVQDVVSSLHMKGSVWCKKGISSEVSGVFSSADGAIYRHCGEHKCPVCEWDEESWWLHVHKVSDIAE